ncbi:hypothetical protein ACQEU8_36625 [Streptomyces sp. CA-250714]|uniref:hypothetical protein n=1 Tax=Streptomyces sp. CA-250714 TaxID=3240060 RepID=UPI003D8C84DA
MPRIKQRRKMGWVAIGFHWTMMLFTVGLWTPIFLAARRRRLTVMDVPPGYSGPVPGAQGAPGYYAPPAGPAPAPPQQYAQPQQPYAWGQPQQQAPYPGQQPPPRY